MIRRVAIMAVVLVVGARAYAQPTDPRQRDAGYIGKDVPLLEVDDCPPITIAKDQLNRVGAEHYERGEVLYVQGDYPGAVTELVSSYCLIPYYTILRDIGQAYERELEYEKAIAYLERYVIAVPADAKRTSACAPDPQDDKKNVINRITVLRNTKAKILVDTNPSDATITLSNDAGTAGLAKSGEQFEVVGGRYQMAIVRDGYQSVTRDIHVEIGKPYTFFERLEPIKGRLSVRVVPADARLFLDKRQIGEGSIDTELPGGHYTLVAEAADRLPTTRDVQVVGDRDTTVSFELTPEPQVGRRQLLGYSALAGGAAVAAVANIQGSYFYDGVAAGAGILGGFAAAWFGTPHDIALGTSSLTITSSLIGGAIGAGIGYTFTTKDNVTAPLGGVGLMLGAGIGYYAGDYLKIRPGDAAVVNSGALWGGVSGGLFVLSFQPKDSIAAGIVLSGVAMGTVGGGLLAHNFSVSRGRAALIDASGIGGLIVGLTTESLASRATSNQVGSQERTANFALGGLAAGLIIGGVLTRHLDEPNLTVTPVLGKTAAAAGGSTTTTFGLSGAF